jgi:malonyl-CoA/methylmalonyl-CoA synthetase
VVSKVAEIVNPSLTWPAMSLLPAPAARPDAIAARFPDGELSRAALEAAAAQLGSRLPAEGPVALWALPSTATAIGLVAALRAGIHVVPLDPRAGAAELARILEVCRPTALIAPEGTALPGLPTIAPAPALGAAAGSLDGVDRSDRGGLIVFTSGTTGPAKGVVLSATAIAANLDALARAWEWSSEDVLVHALPLFHVHGLVVATLGALRRGTEVRHLGGFDAAAIAAALGADATMLFAVPTMYHRLADAAAADPAIARGLRGARLLVSGSAALAAAEHARIEALCGQRIVERYGMTETLMIASIRARGERRAGYVGRPLEGVEVRVVGEDGADLPADDATIGDVLVRGASLFDGYLAQESETRAAFRDGWFATGDLGTLAPDGYLRLVGRRSTDLIKSGGYRIGAGEIESALLEHPAVAEAAVLGVGDEDLGERIVAWVVCRAGAVVDERELVDHVALALAPHKRPREVRFVESLPRNALGKVQKRLLYAPSS